MRTDPKKQNEFKSFKFVLPLDMSFKATVANNGIFVESPFMDAVRDNFC
jgi:hypothetical protein